MPELQTREAKLLVALAKIQRSSGFKRNHKTDELESYTELRGDLADVVKTVIRALDS